MRKAFASLLLLLGSFSAHADDLYVVELALFTCPHCLAVENSLRPLEAIAGERLSFAPVPDSDPDMATLSYYAMRDAFGTQEKEFRAALFAARQTLLLPLANSEEVIEYLQQRGLRPPMTANELDEAIRSSDVNRALGRLQNLMELAGVTAVPSFVLIRDGQVLTSIQKGSESAQEFMRRVVTVVRENNQIRERSNG